MPEAVYRMLTLRCSLVGASPIGTNLGRLHRLWMLVCGRLLTTRGAVFAGLSDCGWSAPTVRRAWAALGQGGWTSTHVLARWQATIAAAGRWQAHRHGGYRPVAGEVTGFWRPRLRAGLTTHYHGGAGKALPAIPLGRIASVGSAGGQRVALPRAVVRAGTRDPGTSTHERQLVRAAVRQCAADAVLVRDGGFGVALLQEAGATRFVVRVAKHATFRRAAPPPSGGRGRPATRGVLVRPLPRHDKGRASAATPPDRSETWHEGDDLLRAAVWTAVVLPEATGAAPPFTAVAIHDPRYREPLVLVTPLPLPPRVLRDCYRDRWPVAQRPLAAKQLLGAARQFVHAPETCQRLPERALLAGAVLAYAAATAPAVPTGFWDRRPQPAPGRLRRLRARTPFPHDFPLPARIRAKAAVTDHLPQGFWGQRRRPSAAPATQDLVAQPAEAA